MSISPAARRQADAEARASLAARKKAVVDALDRIQKAFDPPLSNGELALGLELQVFEIGRFRSTASRLRAALPDSFTMALVNGLVEGRLLPALLDDPRESKRVLQLCTPDEAARLGMEWEIKNLAGGGIPERRGTWDEEDAWDMFGDGRPVALPAAAAAGETIRRAALRIGPADDPLLISPLGLGAMRLSTAGRPDEARARATLHAALDGGVTFIDTADVYALDETDLHHNERLIAAVLAERDPAERERVVVATKAGLIRRGARWLPCGDPAHLTSAVEASLAALGRDRLDLVQLHAVDRNVAIERSVEALEALRLRGLVRHIGLCNVDVAQIEAARRVAPIVSVQNAWSPLDKAAFTKGVVAACRRWGIARIAHSPLGGHKRGGRLAKDALLNALADERGTSPEAVALAQLMDAGFVPIPGASRPETAAASAAAMALHLDGEAHAKLDARFEPIAVERPPVFSGGAAPEIVIVMGPPAAGKSSRVEPLVEMGYHRLNRDEIGGKLADLIPHIDAGYSAGHRRFVLDNTYPDRASRAAVLAKGSELGLPVRCLFIDATVEQARFNAARRIFGRYGRMLDPEELAQAGKADVNTFPPVAIAAWFRRFEAPSADEGFASVTVAPYQRVMGPEYRHRALILDYDGTLRQTRSGAPFPRTPQDVLALPGRAAVLTRFREAGWRLLGVSNQGGVAAKMLSYEMALAGIGETQKQLGLRIDTRFCPHPARPAKCWCRKPLPGFGIEFVERHRLDPARCIYVGDMKSDADFARGMGFRYFDAEFFFSTPPDAD